MNSNLPSAITGEKVASELVPAAKISGDDEQDTALLRTMLLDATGYIRSFSWCDTIFNSYFGGGVGGIFAIFFFHIRPKRLDVDPWIWVITGDIPPAYIPLADCASPSEAFQLYMSGMTTWVKLARLGRTAGPEDGVPPIALPSTPEWADRMSQKLHGLKLAIAPYFEEPDKNRKTQ